MVREVLVPRYLRTAQTTAGAYVSTEGYPWIYTYPLAGGVFPQNWTCFILLEVR